MSNIITGRRIFANNDKLQGGPFLPITGGNLTGNLNGVTPTELTYLSGLTSNVQNQLNNIVTGLSWKDSVRAATTGNITLSGTQTIDGVALIAGDRVLVKDQTDPTENGLYDVSAGAWTRTTDADTGAELLQATVMVEEGTLNADTMWTGTANDPITIGVTALPFIKTSATTYTSSNGITLTGNNFTLTTGFFSGDATILNGVITIDPNFVTNNLGVTCVPLIQVSTINSCSPLAINPLNGEFVGIGIAIPTDKLEVRAADQKGISVSRLADSIVTSKLYTQNGIGGLVTLHDDTGSLKIAFIGGGTSGNGAHSYINTTANFGVGLTAPTARLHTKGIDSTSGASAFRATDSLGIELFSIRNDGNVFTSRYLTYITNNNNLIDFGASGGVELRSNVVTSMLSPIVYLSSASDHFIKLDSTGRQILLRGDTLDFYQSANNIGSAFNVTHAVNATVAYFFSSLASTFLGVGITTPTATLHIKGGGNTSATFTAKFQNSSNVLSLQVRDDGSVYNLGGGSIATNTAFGMNALIANTTGAYNASFGNDALIVAQTADGNSAFGYRALYSNVSSIGNSAFGYRALHNTTGTYNTAFGYNALLSNISGQRNTAVGNAAGQVNTGSYNTYLGEQSGVSQTTGSFNTYIGDQSAALHNGGSNNIALGYAAGFYQTAPSNTLFINSIDHGSAANDLTKSLIYGIFAATPATQFLTFNANVTVSTLAGTGERLVLVNAAGDLTVGATPTLVTGGGTLALGGFTLTVPATGTAVLGSGAANRVALWTGTNTLSSSANWTWNSTTGTIYSSSTNAAVTTTTQNANAGTVAVAQTISSNGTYTISINQYGSGVTGGGLIVPHLSSLSSSSNVGTLFANTAAATKFWWSIAGTEIMRLTTVGLGIKTLADPTSTLHANGSFAGAYRAITGTYVADITDHTINATSGTFTLNLPTAVGITGRQYNIKNSGAGIVTIDAAGTETIDGALTKVLAVQYGSFTLISDGANWGIY